MDANKQTVKWGASLGHLLLFGAALWLKQGAFNVGACDPCREDADGEMIAVAELLGDMLPLWAVLWPVNGHAFDAGFCDVDGDADGEGANACCWWEAHSDPLTLSVHDISCCNINGDADKAKVLGYLLPLAAALLPV